MLKLPALAAILISLATAPSFAAAVTYTGTLGGEAVIFELTGPEDGPLLGRYSYQSHGADVPLHALSMSKYDAVLAEEAPCKPALCVQPNGDLVTDPPLGGQFRLHYSANGTKLTGTWRASASATTELEVDLTRARQRDYRRQEGSLYDSFLWKAYDGVPIAPDTTPYDHAKMQVALSEGPLQTVNGAAYHDVTDPRTKFAFPRVVSLPGGGDIAPVNTMLDEQRWGTNLAGFECLGQDYLSGGWGPHRVGDGHSPLGDIDQESISVVYLSDTVMTISQSGSLYCGGPTLHNHTDYYTYDVRGGRHLDLSHIFKDWDATSNDPRQALIDWVIAAYLKTPDYDADYATECEINENIAKHLDVGFAPNDRAVFLIGGIDQAACMGAIVSVPLADIRNLLSVEAADYFPSLKS